ncbi:hypothetical protein AKO1_004584, partial [Acrasis kona]
MKFSQDPIKFSQARFVNVPVQIDNVDTFDVNGHLRVQSLCDVYRHSAFQIPSLKEDPRSMQNCLALVNNYSHLTESEWFHQTPNLTFFIDVFCNQYWQTQLFWSRSNSIEFSTIVYPMSLQTINHIPSTIGSVIDFHVSLNSQYMFLSVSRKRFELDSIDTYD